MGLIDELPRTSRVSEAIHDDDELAELMDGTAVASERSVRVTEYTPEVEALSEVAHRLGVLVQVVTGIAGKPHTMPDPPVPKGARERLLARREDEAYAGLLGDIESAYDNYRSEHPEED